MTITLTRLLITLILGTLCGTPCANQAKYDPTKSSKFVDLNQTSTAAFATGGDTIPVHDLSEWVLVGLGASPLLQYLKLKLAELA